MADDVALPDDMPEVRTLPLEPDGLDADDSILEALARGEPGPSLPIAHRPLADVMAAVHWPATAAEAAAEAGALEMFRALRATSRPRRRSVVGGGLLRPKMLLAAGAITMASATGAAAATGSLPGAAQDTAARVLATLGITVAGSNDHGDGHPAGSGGDSTTTTTAAPTTTTAGKGDTISSLATDPSMGDDKAAAVSLSASDGHSNAGTNGPPSDTAAGPPSSLPDQTSSSAAARPPSSPPAHPPSSLPAGPPSSVPAGPPSSLPAHVPSSLPAGPPSSLPAHAPSSLPAGSPSSPPVGPPATEPAPPHRP